MFRFRLQRVLELREQREKAEALALADAERVAAVARAERDQLTALHSASRATLSRAQTADPTVGQLQHLDYVLSALDERIGQASADVESSENVVSEARRTLEFAARDRRVLDRLKDKHEDAHNAVVQHQDRVHMDEIALGRFTRRQSDNQNARSTNQNMHQDSPENTNASSTSANGVKEG